MNAVAQLRPPVEVMPEPELLHAALDACSQSMAVSEGGQIIFANPAFAQRARRSSRHPKLVYNPTKDPGSGSGSWYGATPNQEGTAEGWVIHFNRAR